MASLRTVLRRLRRSVPHRFHWIVSPVERSSETLRSLRIDLWEAKGDERQSGLPISVVCAAANQEKHYLLKLIFGSVASERRLRRIWRWQLAEAEAGLRRDHSMLIIEVRKSRFAGMRAQGYFTIPSWVKGSVSVPLDPKVLSSETIKKDAKKLKEYKLEVEVSRDPAKLKAFYQEMYAPYMRQAHGETAYIEPFQEFSAFRDWELLLIKKEGEWIAGQYVLYTDSEPSLYRVGVRDGNPQYLKDRIIGAVYQVSFRHLADRGFTAVHIGWSRAFLKDGALRYKQKFQHRLTGTSVAGFALKVFSYDAATRSFLRNNPFVAETADGLCGNIFVDEDKPLDEAATRQLHKDYFHPGLVKLSTYPFPPVEPEQDLQAEAANIADEGKLGARVLS